ncbi:helix-turn-helix domain-containing protein [Morganella morganii]
MSVNAIAENLGISKVTLYRYLKYRGVQVGRKG